MLVKLGMLLIHCSPEVQSMSLRMKDLFLEVILIFPLKLYALFDGKFISSG